MTFLLSPSLGYLPFLFFCVIALLVYWKKPLLLILLMAVLFHVILSQISDLSLKKTVNRIEIESMNKCANSIAYDDLDLTLAPPNASIAQWLNTVVMSLWTVSNGGLGPYVSDILERQLNAELAMVPSGIAVLHLSSFSLGGSAPVARTLAVKTLPADSKVSGSAMKDRIMAVADIGYASNELAIILSIRRNDVKAALPEIRVTATEINFSCKLLVFIDLLPDYPFVGNMTFSFLSTPTLDVTFVGFGGVDLSLLPGVYAWVNMTAHWVMSQYTYPNNGTVDLLPVICPRCVALMAQDTRPVWVQVGSRVIKSARERFLPLILMARESYRNIRSDFSRELHKLLDGVPNFDTTHNNKRLHVSTVSGKALKSSRSEILLANEYKFSMHFNISTPGDAFLFFRRFVVDSIRELQKKQTAWQLSLKDRLDRSRELVGRVLGSCISGGLAWGQHGLGIAVDELGVAMRRISEQDHTQFASPDNGDAFVIDE